uniref:Major facilitator superfamily (MFS) profile domain-containing protein n=1 Tax=Timema poppense TaxID=170557 RepID=A0A7R9H888_TIMPO|nr:unnamed protein product [Timema poppensis]
MVSMVKFSCGATSSWDERDSGFPMNAILGAENPLFCHALIKVYATTDYLIPTGSEAAVQSSGLAWLIIPHDVGLTEGSFIYNSWRIFLLICSVPSFMVAVLLFFLPESPKFLLSRGDHDLALEIFRNIYHSNTGKPRETYPVKQLLIDGKEQEKKEIGAEVMVVTGKLRDTFNDIMDNSKQIFIPPILRFTIISITINLTFHIGYYGLMMWFPELFNRFNKYSTVHPGKAASVCEVTNFVVNMGGQADSLDCSDKIESSVFLESLITVAAAIPSNIIAVLGMDRLGRKFFLVYSSPMASLVLTDS